jgi:cell division cycle 2-like
MYSIFFYFMYALCSLCRSKLRELFPVTSFSGGIGLSDQGLDLLGKLLHMDPKQRISAGEALQHPWLTVELPTPTETANMPTFRSRADAE